jgi:hypothetical protein
MAQRRGLTTHMSSETTRKKTTITPTVYISDYVIIFSNCVVATRF